MGSGERRKGVIYGRQSLTLPGSTSREDQVTTCQAEAERHDIEVVDVILEPPSTGAYKNRGKNRPHWPELLDLVRHGKVQVVIAFKTDRLSRGGGPGWAPLIEAAETAGLNPDRFVLIAGSGFMSEFEIGIRASMDREESKKTSDRVKQARAHKAMEGKPLMGGPRAFGYLPDRVTIDPEEAELIRSAARRVVAGETVNAVCRDWNAAGVRTTTGREWRRGSMIQTLTSPRMAGLRQYGRNDPNGRDPVIIGDAVWDPILDRVTWERLRARLYSPVKANRRRGSLYLLTRFLYCGRCGHPMYGNTPAESETRGTRAGGVRYACLRQPGSGSCGGNSILAEPTDDYVTDKVLFELRSKNFVARLRQRRRADADVEAKEADVVECEAHMLRLYEEFGSGQIPRTRWLAMERGAQARLDKALAAVQPHRQGIVLDNLGDLRTLEERWPDLELDSQRAAVGAVVDRITVGRAVKRGRIDGRLKIDFLS